MLSWTVQTAIMIKPGNLGGPCWTRDFFSVQAITLRWRPGQIEIVFGFDRHFEEQGFIPFGQS
jgi:hypothetical protein